jgi:hypothetical protein
MYRELHALSLIVLACILGYGLEWKGAAILCCLAAGFTSLGIIRDGLGDLYYGQLTGELDEYGDPT